MLERTRHYKTASKEDLTPRQREVLRMIADGKTNPEIAERLGITLDGAKFHVREILAKLEVDSREEAAEWWRAHRGLGTRIASSVRALIPAAWLKPVLAGSAVGGLALGSVVVGLALNGGSERRGAAGPLPECQLLDITPSVVSSGSWSGATVFMVSASTKADCVFDGSGWGRIVFPGADPLPITAPTDEDVLVNLTPADRRIATATWSNWCGELPPGTFAQFDLRTDDPARNSGIVATAENLPLPECNDAAAPSTLSLAFESDDVAGIAACDTATMSWSTKSVMDGNPFAGLRYVMLASAPERCVLDAVVGVAAYGSTANGASTWLVNAGAPVPVTIEKQLISTGDTPLISGNVANVCNSSTGVILVITTPAQSSYSLDVNAPPCFDATREATFTAEWNANVMALRPTGTQPRLVDPWWEQMLDAPAVPRNCVATEIEWKLDPPPNVPNVPAFTWSASATTPCRLKETLDVSVAGSGTSSLREASAVEVDVLMGPEPLVVVDVMLMNVCDAGSVVMGIAFGGHAAYVLDAGPASCIDDSRPHFSWQPRGAGTRAGSPSAMRANRTASPPSSRAPRAVARSPGA